MTTSSVRADTEPKQDEPREPRSAHQPDRHRIACVWCRNRWPCERAREDQR